MGGTRELRELIDGRPGEIPADIVQRGNEIWMVKTCPKHGTFEDLMSNDAAFFGRLEKNFFGRDVKMGKDTLHEHGSVVDPVRAGRRPDGRPDEPLQHDVQPLLHGREPGRLRPRADLGRHQGDPRQRGLHQAAAADVGPVLGRRADALAPLPRGDPLREGDRLLLGPVRLERRPLRAGARSSRRPRPRRGSASSTSSSTGSATSTNEHRGVSNLYDVKLRALENLKAAGIDVTLVITIVNGVNNDQVGDIVRFAIENIDKINALSFQPVSFTGRDEEIDDETRKKQRYTLSHLARDVKAQAGHRRADARLVPALGVGSLLRPARPPRRTRGGVGLAQVRLPPELRHRHDAARQRPRPARRFPVTQILDADRLLRDLTVITDAARGRFLTILQTALAVARNIRPAGRPEEPRHPRRR